MTSATYTAHPKYRFLAGIWAGIAALFIWQLGQGMDMGALLFLVIAVALLAWYARNLASRVTLDARQVRLQRPLAADTVIEFRQLAGVGEEGRMGQAILLHYHPLRHDGLVDLDNLRSLALPAVVGQAELAATLAKQVPA